MSVYVDLARNRLGRMIMCHMIADTAAELHTMAMRIGMERAWYQTPDAPKRASFPHYDVSLSRRDLALHYGAQPLHRNEFVAKMREIRARIIADETFASEWRYHA